EMLEAGGWAMQQGNAAASPAGPVRSVGELGGGLGCRVLGQQQRQGGGGQEEEAGVEQGAAVVTHGLKEAEEDHPGGGDHPADVVTEAGARGAKQGGEERRQV